MFGVDKYVFPREFSVFNPTLHDIGIFWTHTHTLSLLESPSLPFLLCSRFLTAMFVLCSSYQTEETGRALCEEDAVHQPHLPPRQEHDIPRQLLLHHQRLGANAWEWVMMSLQLRSPVIEEETVQTSSPLKRLISAAPPPANTFWPGIGCILLWIHQLIAVLCFLWQRPRVTPACRRLASDWSPMTLAEGQKSTATTSRTTCFAPVWANVPMPAR